MSEITIERAHAEDAGPILTNQRAAYLEEAIRYEDVTIPPLLETLDEVQAAMTSGTMLVARHGDRIVGAARAQVRERVCYVGRLSVAPDMQGRGIGAALLARIEEAHAGEVDAFILFTGDRSERNLALYESRGYVRTHVEPVGDRYGLVHLRKTVAAGSLRGRLLGTWILRTWESIGEDGSIVQPMGPDPLGVVVYTADGTMITNMGRRDRSPIAGGDILGGPVEERLAALESFISYAGTFRIDGSDVIHTVTMSLFPNWVGTQQRRHVQISTDGRELTLVADPFLLRGRVGTQRVTWDRRTG